MDFKDYNVSKIVELCKNCGHDINFHRFLKSIKPTACVVCIKDKDNLEKYCQCSKFIGEC